MQTTVAGMRGKKVAQQHPLNPKKLYIGWRMILNIFTSIPILLEVNRKLQIPVPINTLPLDLYSYYNLLNLHYNFQSKKGPLTTYIEIFFQITRVEMDGCKQICIAIFTTMLRYPVPSDFLRFSVSSLSSNALTVN